MRAIAFKFFQGVLTVRYGFVNKLGVMRVFDRDIAASGIEPTKGYIKCLMVGKEQGTIHNNFIWFEWDGSYEQENEYGLKAAKIFKSREDSMLHEYENKIDKCIENSRKLAEIIDLCYAKATVLGLLERRKQRMEEEAVTDKNIYKVGDRVEVISRSSRHIGRRGVIERVVYKVRFDDGSDSAFVEDSLAKFEAESEDEK